MPDYISLLKSILRWAYMKFLAFSLLLLVTVNVSATPCDGVDRSLSDARKNQLAPVIAKQLNVKSVEILQSFSYRNWFIIYASTHVSDNPFLFFSGDPTLSNHLTIWSGAATVNEWPEINQWVLNNAKGIPSKLASCFAWRVTKGHVQ